MKIIRAELENFQRIEVVEITPAGDVVEISGSNEQGKSSILDGIQAALLGRRYAPKEPVRRGQETGRASIDLGDDGVVEIIVERTWTASSDRLVVRTPEGAAYPKPQALLSGIADWIAFDALKFQGLSDSEQTETLLKAVGVDLDEIEQRRSAAYDRRREAGRELRAAKARLDGAPKPAKDTPKEPVSMSGLMDELTEARRVEKENEEARNSAWRLVQEADRAEELAAEADATAVETKEEIERLQQRLANQEEYARRAHKRAADTRKTAKDATEAVDGLDDPDLDEIQERMAQVETINAEVRKAKDRKRLRAEVKRYETSAAAAQKELDDIDAEKERVLSEAEMPVEGLGISDDGVTYEGLPLSQASMSRRIRVCTAIGAALNPKLKIALVRHGNDLDDEAIREFYAYCAEAGLQVWVERIKPATEGAIVIEAGRVAS